MKETYWKSQCALESRRAALFADALRRIAEFPPQGKTPGGQVYAEAWAVAVIQKIATDALGLGKKERPL